jgi:Gpi18-like mannosyltransferase
MTIMLLVHYVLLAVTFTLWVQFLFQGFRKTWEWVGLGCIWLNYFPLLEAVVGREIELLELFLITVGIHALRQKRQVIAGAVMGLAAMTKFLPLIFLPYLLMKGYRRAFWAAAGVVLAIAALTQLLLGFEHSMTWMLLKEEAGSGGFSNSTYATQALGNALAKMVTPWDLATPHPHTPLPHLMGLIGVILHGVVLLACGWFLFKWRRYQLLELECALLSIVMVLVAPHANTYYFVLALPAISVGFASLVRHAKEVGFLLKVAIIGAIVLSGLFLVPMKVFEVILGVQGMLVARFLQFCSLPAFGGILAALALVGLHQTERRLPVGVREYS